MARHTLTTSHASSRTVREISVQSAAHSDKGRDLSEKQKEALLSYRGFVAATDLCGSIATLSVESPWDAGNDAEDSDSDEDGQGGSGENSEKKTKQGKKHALEAQPLVGIGRVRLWQVDEEELASEVALWKRMFARPGEDSLKGAGMLRVSGDAAEGMGVGGAVAQIARESEERRNAPPPLKDPVHGQIDPENTPHVGGSNWAGGTGGSNTAGLGGRGGPYRLDAGHKVHQVSDEMKAEVSKEAKRAANEMAQNELSRRLAEIDMSEGQFEAYEGFLNPIIDQVDELKLILGSLEGKQNERKWLKHQQDGELDDARIVDGLSGERRVFKKRGLEDAVGMPGQSSPKLITFSIDCSGSMYRFNGTDGRLDRQLELW